LFEIKKERSLLKQPDNKEVNNKEGTKERAYITHYAGIEKKPAHGRMRYIKTLAHSISIKLKQVKELNTT